MERIHFPFVRQQFDDDDGTGKRQCHRHVQGADRCHAQGQPDAETDQRGEQHLTQAGRQRYRPQCANQLQIELQPYQKQQYGNAQFRQQFHTVGGLHQIQHRRPGDDAGGNEAHHHGLAQHQSQQTDHRRHHQQRRQFRKRGFVPIDHERVSAAILLRRRSRNRTCFSSSMMKNRTTPMATTLMPSTSGTDSVPNTCCNAGT